MEPIAIVVVHKNKKLRSHIVDFLAQAGLNILADIDNIRDLQAKTNDFKFKPNIILVDIELLHVELREFVVNLKQVLPGVKLVLTGPAPQSYYARYFEALGADLYLSEGLDPQEWATKLKGTMKTA